MPTHTHTEYQHHFCKDGHNSMMMVSVFSLKHEKAVRAPVVTQKTIPTTLGFVVEI